MFAQIRPVGAVAAEIDFAAARKQVVVRIGQLFEYRFRQLATQQIDRAGDRRGTLIA